MDPDKERVEYCDYCAMGFAREAYRRFQCSVCIKLFDVCRRHSAFKTYQCINCGSILCPDCIGWDNEDQKYTGTCQHCGEGQAPTVSDSDFSKFQEDREDKRGYKRPKLPPPNTSPIPLVLGLNMPDTYNSVSTYTKKELRIMSWNVRDLGGGPSDIPATRDDACISTIARMIFIADPHVCAIIEVKAGANHAVKAKPKSNKKTNPFVSSYSKSNRKKSKATPVIGGVPGGRGIAELKRIMAELNKFDTSKQWTYCTHKDNDILADGETYAFIYKVTPDIALVLDSNIYVTKDKLGNDIHFPKAQNRRPMQAIFEFSGTLACKGNKWRLPVVAYHAPAPNHGQDTVDAVASLVKMGIYIGATLQDLPEFVVCADLNIDSNYSLNYTKEGGELTYSAYAEQGMNILEKAGLTHWVTTETSHNTTLKEVTTHYMKDEYNDEADLIQDDHLVWLFDPLIDKTEFDKRKTEFLAHHEYPTKTTQEIAVADEVIKECKAYYDQEKSQLTNPKLEWPDSTFDYTNASYDKILLFSKIVTRKEGLDDVEDIDGSCVLQSGGDVCVFPMMSLLVSKTVLSRYFDTRDRYSPVNLFAFEGDLATYVKELYPYYYKKLCSRFDDAISDGDKKKQQNILTILFEDETKINLYLNNTDWSTVTVDFYDLAFPTGITEKEMTKNACLLIAGQISDHLPLFMSAVYD